MLPGEDADAAELLEKVFEDNGLRVIARSRAEDSRVQVRGIRGKAKKELEAIKKDGEAGEDDVKRAEHELDGLTKRFVEQIDAALSAKEAELLEV